MIKISEIFSCFSIYLCTKNVFRFAYLNMTVEYTNALVFRSDPFIALHRKIDKLKKNVILRQWSDHSVLLAQQPAILVDSCLLQ